MSTSDQSSRPDPVQADLQGNSGLIALSEMDIASWRSRELSFSHAPHTLPESIQPPKYAIGDRCGWIPMNSTDWGTIIGQVLAPVELVQPTTPQWIWIYLVLLDSNSPSRQWVTTDWAEEDDLERFDSPVEHLTNQRNLHE